MTDNIERAEDFLEHFGVKGMKWGVKKSEGGGTGFQGPAKSKPTKADILEARNNISSQARAAENKYYEKVGQTDARYAANKLKDPATAKAVRDKGYKKAMEQLDKDYGQIDKDPDAAIANKMTTGEKWATAATLTLTGVAFAGYAAAVAGSMNR